MEERRCQGRGRLALQRGAVRLQRWAGPPAPQRDR